MVELETVERIASYMKGMAGQALINGNFDIWQRGTSSTSMAILADKWSEYADGNGGTLPTLTRSREVLSGEIDGSYYYTRLTTSGAGTSLGTTSRHWLWQSIENGTRYLAGTGNKVTLSFWARSSIANKKISANLQQSYGSGGSPSSTEVINGTTFALTSAWTKYTHTFTLNDITGKTFGTDTTTDIIVVLFQFMWGSGTYSTPAGSAGVAETYRGAGTIDIAQVQLCLGSKDLPFFPRSLPEEEKLCDRYYQRIIPNTTTYCASGPIRSSTQGDMVMALREPMRAVPTFSYGGTWGLRAGSTTHTVTNITLGGMTGVMAYLVCTSGSMTAERGGGLYGTSGAYMQFTADL